jgi:hypothetical protein
MFSDQQNNYAYDIALSFASENRDYVEQLCTHLEQRNIKVFYDNNEVHDLLGKDLIEHLATIYKEKALFCAMIISEFYPLKRWTNHERRQAQARAFRDANEYILPLRLDDAEVPGITETTGYLDLRNYSVEQVAEILMKKVAKAKGKVSGVTVPGAGASLSVPSFAASIPMPQRQKSFTQFDKDQFASDAFDFIRSYFKQGLDQLEAMDPNIKTRLTSVTSLEFMCKIYDRGSIVAQCTIWLEDTKSSGAIYYFEGAKMMGHGRSYNDFLSVTETKDELRLQISGMAIGIVQPETSQVTKEQAAAYLWKRLMQRLNLTMSH